MPVSSALSPLAPIWPFWVMVIAPVKLEATMPFCSLPDEAPEIVPAPVVVMVIAPRPVATAWMPSWSVTPPMVIGPEMPPPLAPMSMFPSTLSPRMPTPPVALIAADESIDTVPAPVPPASARPSMPSPLCEVTDPVDVIVTAPPPEVVWAKMPPAPRLPPLATSMVLAELIWIEPLSLTAPIPALPPRVSGSRPLPLPTTVIELPAPVVMVILPDSAPPVASANTPPELSPVTLMSSPLPIEMSVAPEPVFRLSTPARFPGPALARPLTVVSTLSAIFTWTPPVEETSTPA